MVGVKRCPSFGFCLAAVLTTIPSAAANRTLPVLGALVDVGKGVFFAAGWTFLSPGP